MADGILIGLPYSNFCSRTHRLDTIHNVTDNRQMTTDGRSTVPIPFQSHVERWFRGLLEGSADFCSHPFSVCNDKPTSQTNCKCYVTQLSIINSVHI